MVSIEAINLRSVQTIGWIFMALSMMLHGVYVLLLARTYTTGDLSQTYPIMRGISPLLVPFAGVFILNEHLGLLGGLGIAGIVFGVLIAGNFHTGKFSIQDYKSVLLAASVGVSITCYTLIDKVALEYLPPFTLNQAGNLGNVIALSWLALKSREVIREWRINWKTIILGGILAPGGYILFLVALENMPVSQLAPMREIGTVFGTLLGIVILKEQHGRSRLVASVLITLGIVLLAQ